MDIVFTNVLKEQQSVDAELCTVHEWLENPVMAPDSNGLHTCSSGRQHLWAQWQSLEVKDALLTTDACGTLALNRCCLLTWIQNFVTVVRCAKIRM